jgi:hypothetical protein
MMMECSYFDFIGVPDTSPPKGFHHHRKMPENGDITVRKKEE